MIAIVDYGAGNLASVAKAFRAVGAEPRVVPESSDLTSASGLVIPGVGHFDATRALGHDWRSAVRSAIDRGLPVLGICLGMQWLYQESDEAPGVQGLGVFNERIVRIRGDVKVPHVGWNALRVTRPSPLLAGLRDGEAVYFTHTYAAPVAVNVLATTSHATEFAAIVERANVAGMQFHPEKSGAAGLRLLANWVNGCSASA